MEEWLSIFNLYILPLGWKLASSVAVWVIGNWLITLLLAAPGKNLLTGKVDPTLARYFEGGAKIALRILLIIAIFGILGIETTSFAALLAATGIAIGAAWGGLLANFAAGTFLVFLRPFKVGDLVMIGDVTGTVREIGLFVTTLDNPDNVQVFVENNAVFGNKIQNFSANPYRRIDLTASLTYNMDVVEVIQNLRAKVEAIPNVLKTPAPVIEVLNTNERGVVLAVYPFCSNRDYWQVYFDTNRAILEARAAAQDRVQEQHTAGKAL